MVLLFPLYTGGGQSPPLSYSQPCLLRLRREKCRERIAGGENSPNVVNLCTIYVGSFFLFPIRCRFLRKTVVNSVPFWSRPVQGRVCKGVEKEEQECDNKLHFVLLLASVSRFFGSEEGENAQYPSL